MMKCQHENAEHMMPGESSTPDWCVQIHAEFEQFRCIDCGEWLALGASNDSYEMFDTEIEVAEHISDICLLYEPGRERTVTIAACVEMFSRDPGNP